MFKAREDVIAAPSFGRAAPAAALTANLIEQRDSFADRLAAIDWNPDLARNIGTPRWFRGLATLIGLGAVAIAFWPGIAPVSAAPSTRLDGHGRDELRSQMIAPLALGADSGRHMAATAAVRPLEAAPERPELALLATVAPGDGLPGMLRRAGVGGGDAERALALIGGLRDVRQPRFVMTYSRVGRELDGFLRLCLLNGLHGMLAPDMDEDEIRLLHIIQDQSRRMNVIIENVTQLARRDKVNPVKLPVTPWIGDFIHQFTITGKHPAEMFQTNGVTDIEVCVDPEQLQQVVGNLCQNALRHSPAFTGQPLIAFKTGQDKENRPFLDVVDWGTGVPTDIVDNIFDPFFTTTPKGTGLGLYIARELCESNGGRLEYFPGDKGGGSRFRVTFARTEECADFVAGAA